MGETDDGLLGVLSADLWLIILEALPLPSICELRSVNSAFHELCAPFLMHRLQLASSSSALFLYFPLGASTREISLNTDFLLVLQGHSHKCLPLHLPSHLPPGFFLKASGGGLLLFCDSRKQVRSPRLLVYNPILGCWKLLPRPPPKVSVHFLGIDVIYGTSHYNVVVVNNTGWVAVYHSETEDWDTLKLAHTNMDVKGLHNGALYWVPESYWHYADVLKVTTLSMRTYDTSSEEVLEFDAHQIFGVSRGRDGAVVLNVHCEGEWVGTAAREQAENGGAWTWCDRVDDFSVGSRIAYAGGVLCNVPWEADSMPWMIDLESFKQSNRVQPFSIKPFCNVPWLNGLLPFQPSATPVAHDIVNNRKKKKKKGFSATKCSSVISPIPIYHKLSCDRPL